jgi:hypothetical protein
MTDDFRVGLAELADAAGVTVREPERERARRESDPPPPRDVAPSPAEGSDPESEVAVAEFADPGAEDGAGAEVHVEEPWPNYREMTAQDIVDRLSTADDAEIAVVRMYEQLHRKRRTVLDATDKVLRSV